MTSKNKHFVMISNDMVRSGKIPPHELVVYINLKSRKGNKQSAWPSHSRIAKETAMSVSKVKLCIRHLQELGYINVSPQFNGPGKQTSNMYLIFDTPTRSKKSAPGAPRGYEEDSFEEDSNTNSPKNLDERKWRHLSKEKPITAKQFEYIHILHEESGHLEDDGCLPDPEDLGEIDQVRANEYIEELWVQNDRERRFE
jgi:DNA-binding MarR family transcriptional regulator